MSDSPDGEIPDFDDEVPTETPFDPKQGIWFKTGRLFMGRESQLKSFDAHCAFSLPEDFLALIGDYAEGGFDGWYEVKKGEFGSIVWNHLLLMRLPTPIDFEIEEMLSKMPQLRDHTSMAVKILERNRSLFYTSAGVLAYFPFGTACCFKSDRTDAEGFLVFDVRDSNCVRFISEKDPKSEFIARSFSEMMNGAVFQFYG